MLIVEACPIADMIEAAAFPELAAEYVRESLIDGMPQPAPDWNAYAALEAAGLLHGFAASVDGELVGFIAVLRAKLPRYAEPIAVSESFFVASAHRGTGAGLKLLRAAEDKARALGCPGLLVSAPAEGVLAQVLPRRGYAETNRVFFKGLADA
jgi:GNAT superfamily N-acetyltransferase